MAQFTTTNLRFFLGQEMRPPPTPPYVVFAFHSPILLKKPNYAAVLWSGQTSGRRKRSKMNVAAEEDLSAICQFFTDFSLAFLEALKSRVQSCGMS